MMEGQHVQERLTRLHAQRRKLETQYSIYLNAFLANPTEESRERVLNIAECIDDIDDEIKTLIAEL